MAKVYYCSIHSYPLPRVRECERALLSRQMFFFSISWTEGQWVTSHGMPISHVAPHWVSAMRLFVSVGGCIYTCSRPAVDSSFESLSSGAIACFCCYLAIGASHSVTVTIM